MASLDASLLCIPDACTNVSRERTHRDRRDGWRVLSCDMKYSHWVLCTGFVVAILVPAGCGSSSNGDGGADADAAGDGRIAHCVVDLDCTDTLFCNGAERCTPGARNADSRGCVPASPASPCTTSQTCDEALQRCVTSCPGTPDADHDGHRAIACGGDDCDDNDANRFPGNIEVCPWDAVNNRRTDPTHDEDCNPDTLSNPATLDGDADHDTYVDIACCNPGRTGAMSCGTDCADTSPIMGVPATFMTTVAPASIHPTQVELCNGIDDNCNGSIDEGLGSMSFYPDCDGDGFGDAHGTVLTACSGVGVPRCSGNPAVSSNSDCDDTNASVHASAGEVCNGIDDNCNGMIDEGLPTGLYYRDCDGDGFGDLMDAGTPACAAGIAPACMMHPALGSRTDCDDTRASVHPLAVEVCNGLDDNCDSNIDRGCPASISLGATYAATLLGATGGTTVSQHCNAGFVVDGFQFHSAAGRIDGVFLTCGPAVSSHTGTPYAYSLTTGPGDLTITPMAGTAVSGYTVEQCPAGAVATGFEINEFAAGTFGSPGMQCYAHDIPGSPGSFNIARGAYTLMPFTIGTSSVCTGVNDLMVGASFWWDSTSIHGVQPLCAPATVVLRP